MIEVEIWSDFTCPFCYIGKKNFDKAAELLAQPQEIKVTYRSFELDPKAEKSQAGSITELLAKKYGKSIQWAEQMNAGVVQTAAAAGLVFNMQKIIPTNSFDAHRLSHLAGKVNKQAEVQDLIFAAYFTNGKDISSRQALIEVGQSIGLSAQRVEQLLGSGEESDSVHADQQAAQQIGIRGVPYFVFDRKLAVSGAQPVAEFTQAFRQLKAT